MSGVMAKFVRYGATTMFQMREAAGPDPGWHPAEAGLTAVPRS